MILSLSPQVAIALGVLLFFAFAIRKNVFPIIKVWHKRERSNGNTVIKEATAIVLEWDALASNTEDKAEPAEST